MIACPACNAADLIQLPDPAEDAHEWYCLECGQAVLTAPGSDLQPLDTLAWRPPAPRPGILTRLRTRFLRWLVS